VRPPSVVWIFLAPDFVFVLCEMGFFSSAQTFRSARPFKEMIHMAEPAFVHVPTSELSTNRALFTKNETCLIAIPPPCSVGSCQTNTSKPPVNSVQPDMILLSIENAETNFSERDFRAA
jgi:hypothetical protein